MESKKRSMVKSIVWRIIGIILLGGITWVFTRDIETTTIITVLFHSIRLVLYYVHERIWDRIEWGYNKADELPPEESDRIRERLRRLGYIE